MVFFLNFISTPFVLHLGDQFGACFESLTSMRCASPASFSASCVGCLNATNIYRFLDCIHDDICSVSYWLHISPKRGESWRCGRQSFDPESHSCTITKLNIVRQRAADHPPTINLGSLCIRRFSTIQFLSSLARNINRGAIAEVENCCQRQHV